MSRIMDGAQECCPDNKECGSDFEEIGSAPYTYALKKDFPQPNVVPNMREEGAAGRNMNEEAAIENKQIQSCRIDQGRCPSPVAVPPLSRVTDTLERALNASALSKSARALERHVRVLSYPLSTCVVLVHPIQRGSADSRAARESGPSYVIFFPMQHEVQLDTLSTVTMSGSAEALLSIDVDFIRWSSFDSRSGDGSFHWILFLQLDCLLMIHYSMRCGIRT
ncbi:hypothetical protein C8R47DRAFT_137849 [Mycena vitilis]|nr:hypothetical protein C8R47DRAFT_137849 [Mycena vitilis]